MTKHDQIIADLMNALDIIRRESEKPDASRHYICGAAMFAMDRCDSQRERNSDGYLVVKQEADSKFREHICGLDGLSFDCPACAAVSEPSARELSAAYQRVLRVANASAK